MTKLDLDKVQGLLDSDIATQIIAEATVSLKKQVIGRYRNGQSDIDNMTIGTAKQLAAAADYLKDHPALDSAIEIKGIRKAVGAFNNWQGAARIYFDKSDMTIWTNVYADSNSWNDYHDDLIVEVKNKLAMMDRDDKTSMRELRELAQEAIAGKQSYGAWE